MNNAPITLTGQTFKRLSSFIESELGIKMPDTKKIMLESRLQKRTRILGLSTIDEYVDFVFSDDGQRQELIHMIDAVTTNKTDFYREPDHFTFLKEKLLPTEVERNEWGTREPFQIWSAGCSSGEEPYTMCFVLEDFKLSRKNFRYQVFASDISTRMLDHAKKAIYDVEKADPIPLDIKKRYLLKSKDATQELVRVKPEIRSNVRFFRLNFMDSEYPMRETFHAVFCRNVIIYFDRANQERIIGRLASCLVKGGYLFLGHSETLTGMDLPLASVAPAAYRKH